MSKKSFLNKKIFIQTVIVIIATACFVMSVKATIVKTNHSNLLKSVTPVPKDAKEAYSKCVVDKDGKISVNASIEKINTQLESSIKENGVPYDTGFAPSNAPQNMPTKAELKKMSKEEKMAWAMRMQQQQPANIETPKNTAAWAKTIELNNKFATLSTGNDSLPMKLLELDKRYSPLHNTINEETSESIKKCPVSSSGEMSVLDPKCVKAKKLIGADKHIALAAKELADLRKLLAEHAATIQGLLAELDALMKEVNYGENEGAQSKTMLNQVQGLALQQINVLQAASVNAHVKSAEWIREKQIISEDKGY